MIANNKYNEVKLNFIPKHSYLSMLLHEYHNMDNVNDLIKS